jgi:hypothetical protein
LAAFAFSRMTKAGRGKASPTQSFVDVDKIPSPTLTLLPYSSDKIYIAQLTADNPLKLKADRVIEFAVLIYNANNVEFKISGTDGAIGCRQIAIPPVNVQGLNLNLQNATIRGDVAKVLPPFKESLLVIWQHIAAKEADAVLHALDREGGLEFNFDRLNIRLDEAGSSTSVRLPLWSAIRVKRGFRSSRVISAKVEETLSTKGS